MKSDLGAEYTDKQMLDLERKLSRLYTQAEKDIEEKLAKFTEANAKKEKIFEQQVKDGKKTQEEFDNWKAGVVFRGQRWDAKMAQVSAVLADTNKVATNILRSKELGVFAMNGNYAAYTFEHGAGVSFGFDLYDEKTVARLLRDDPNILPFKKLDKAKDVKWNFKNIKSQVTQGLIQGESIPQIAKRLAEAVPDRNEKQMVLHARTAMTAAQNAGRMERYEEAEDLGIKFKKVWLATLDSRTRDTHIELDGQAVKPEEPFKVAGYEIDYPGDPHADPEMVYNCRCTMTTELDDYPSTFNRRETATGEVIEDMTYNEWVNWKEKGSDEPAHVVVQGQDITDTWKRRQNEFDFEIQDAINAQGFDGLPKIVPQEEFDEAVRAANDGKGFIAQRTYTAEDQETLDAYREQLYDGEWYVDCSTGGAQYGQGMYCAADYSGNLSDGIKAEMEHYASLGQYRHNGNDFECYVETLTLDPSAKIISYDDVSKMYNQYREAHSYNSYKYKALNSYLDSIGIENARDRLEYQTMWNLYNRADLTAKNIEKLEQLQDKFGNPNLHDMNGKITDIIQDLSKDDIKNIGSYAALKGYDAINAIGHGESGSYTVILNRTKLIIKEP